MKKLLLSACLLLACIVQAYGQYQAGYARTWDRYPPEAQERGFGLYASKTVQMDNDPALEEVFLFSSDNGHYPYFDIFRIYYVVVDYYSKEIKYKSNTVRATERMLTLEDRNQDGKYELYRKYFLDDKFSVDEYGNNLKVTWAYDCIQYIDNKNIVTNR